MTSSGTWAASAHLVRSTGFGASGALVDAVDTAGAASWLRSSLAADPGLDPGAKATPPPTFDRVEPAGKGATREAKQQRRKQARAQVNELVAWWIRRMVAVHNPVAEKLTFGWHNHFATSASKVKSAAMLLAQNEKLRSGGRGPFSDLAQEMVVDPAMLYWLDAQKNTAKAPNENLAREFMELFTLGHGSGYTETDVREGARALTGWALSRSEGTVRFVAKRHDDRPKTLLGTTADLDTAGFVRVVLAQPASAPFIASRWWRVLAAPDAPPAETLARMVTAYGPGRDLTALFTTLLTDPTYATAAGSLVMSPVEWVVGALRALAIAPDDAMVRKTAALMRSLGQRPFYPPNVSGWPSGQAWLSTASATTRVRAATMLARAGDLHTVADQPTSARVDATAHLLGIATWSARTATVLKQHVDDPQRLVATALVSPENLVI